jgi:hypothetical protein
MTVSVLLLGIATVLAVAAVGVSLFAVWRSQALAELADQRAHAHIEELCQNIARLQKALDNHVAHLRYQAVPSTMSAIPRAGLNLGKRTQVLRMHRNGDAPDRIAATLEVPLQEVDLLIKVHRIVLSSR